MAKLTIKPRALRQLEEIVANVIEFTGFEVSGIRLQNDISIKLNRLLLCHCLEECEMMVQESVLPDFIELSMTLINKPMK